MQLWTPAGMQRATGSRHMPSMCRANRIRRKCANLLNPGVRAVGWSLTMLPPALDIPGAFWSAMYLPVFFEAQLCRYLQFQSINMFFFLCGFRGIRKRSISPVQMEQGGTEPVITDGWSHYSYPDSTGSKKMKTDGAWTCAYILHCSKEAKCNLTQVLPQGRAKHRHSSPEADSRWHL